MNRLPNSILGQIARHVPKTNLASASRVSKGLRAPMDPRNRKTNTNRRLLNLRREIKRVGRTTPRQYHLSQASLYKALSNYETLRNLNAQSKRNLKVIRSRIYNQGPNIGEIHYGGYWWISPTHQNNTGRYTTVYVNRNGEMNVLAYNAATKRYVLNG